MTLLETIQKSTTFLEQNGVPSPRLQAELIIAHTLQLPRLQLYLQFDRPLNETTLSLIRPLIKRRSKREPLQHILGQTTFLHCTIQCTPDALIPRPETERLVEIALQHIPTTPQPSILDICTGTGAIALAIAHALPQATITATDISPQAIALAQRNHQNLPHANITWLQTNLLDGMTQPAHIILTNPPYLTTQQMENLPPEVQADPPLALHGGQDGLDLIRQIIPRAYPLAPTLILEHGHNHAETCRQLALQAGYTTAHTENDLTGTPRFLVARHDTKVPFST